MAEKANVLLYIPSRRDAVAVEQLEHSLPAVDGVSRVQRGRKLPNVVLVDYDPGRVSAYSILAHALGLGIPVRLAGT